MDYNYLLEELRKETDILERINDFEAVRDRLSVRVVNTCADTEKHDSLASETFLDLYVTFVIILYENDDYKGMIRVSKELADSWEVSTEEIMEAALANDLEKGGFRMDSLSEVLKNMGGMESSLSGEMERIEDLSGEKMYIIYDRTMRSGSTAILMNDLLREYSLMLDSDLVILPSSTNELICIGDSPERDYQWLKSIVREVNDTFVTESELLSYSVYKYTRETDRVTIVA